MRSELFWLLSLCGFAALSLVCGLLAWSQLSAAWPSIEEKIDRFRRQPPLAKVVLLVFVVGFIAYGGSKTNQVDQTSGTNEVDQVKVEGEGEQWNLLTCSAGQPEQGSDILCSPSPLAFTSAPPPVTPADIARGWQLWEVKTNCNISYAMPESAAFATNWWVRGAYEDVNQFDFREWRFPFGSNEHRSAWAFSWGKLRLALADTNTEIVAVGAPMSAVPHCSRLWSAADTNGSRLVTWENFALNRDTNTPVNAQVELRTTGDFITRSNEVETVYRRLDPEDWDGDGWRNDDDPDPYVWEEYWDNFWQYLPDGANTNVYYWVDIRPRWNSYIEFFGDGPSDLEDPCIWAKAGETYRVQLLIGKTYDVESDRPFEIVAKSDARIEVSNVESDSCTVVWPVTLTVAEGRAPVGRPRLGATWNDGGSTFHVLPDPPWLNGRIMWDTYCCALQGDGTNFTYACDGNCTCEGCTASGNYIYAGYALPFWSWPCGCHHVDDQGDAGVTIDFDRSAVIYEDTYTNMPGVVVTPARSNAVLRCEVWGGTYGGTLSVTLSDAAQQKLSKVRGDELPTNLVIEPGSGRSYVVVYSVSEPSGSVGDIKATAVFHENFLNVVHSNDTAMTAVKVEISPEDPAPENLSLNRHLFGVHEMVNYRICPEDADVDLADGQGGRLISVDDYGRCFYCPWTGGVFSVVATCGSGSYTISFSVVEPQVECRGALWNDLLDTNAVEGTSGWVGMRLILFLLPKTVSFQRLQMVEIPVPSSEAHELASDDYFSIMPDVLPRTHDASAGADIWKIPQFITGDGYYWTGDKAQMPNECPPVTNRLERIWAQGTMNWEIPVGWGLSRILEGQMKQNPTSQVYEMSEDGTLTIRKYNHWIRRDVSGRVWLDGHRVNAWWSDLW